MSLARNGLLAGLDALPFAILAGVAAVVFGLAGDLAPSLVGAVAAVVGAAVLLVLASVSANRYQQDGKRFYFVRAVVVEGLFSLP